MCEILAERNTREQMTIEFMALSLLWRRGLVEVKSACQEELHLLQKARISLSSLLFWSGKEVACRKRIKYLWWRTLDIKTLLSSHLMPHCDVVFKQLFSISASKNFTVNKGHTMCLNTTGLPDCTTVFTTKRSLISMCYLI